MILQPWTENKFINKTEAILLFKTMFESVPGTNQYLKALIITFLAQC